MAETLHQEFEQQALNPPAGDERIAAFSQAMLNICKKPAGAELLAAVEARRFETVSYGANLLLRAVQKQLIDTDPDYPVEYDEYLVWQSNLSTLLNSSEQSTELFADIKRRTTVSNVVKRYKAFKLASELMSPWLPEAPQVLDVGCSRNHGLKKLHLNMSFEPIECGITAGDSRLSPALVARLCNAAIASPRTYGASTGIDISPLDAPGAAKWAKSCSFYPSELLDQAAVAEYDYLEAATPPGVNFAQADILGATVKKLGQYDVVTASTFLYQLTSEQRTAARVALRGLVAEGGVVLYQDFAKRGREGSNLHHEDSWFASLYPYRTLAELPSRSGDQLYELFRWSDGRCRQWAPGRDLDELINKVNIA